MKLNFLLDCFDYGSIRWQYIFTAANPESPDKHEEEDKESSVISPSRDNDCHHFLPSDIASKCKIYF